MSALPPKADMFGRRNRCLLCAKARHLVGIVIFVFPVAPIMAKLPATPHRVQGSISIGSDTTMQARAARRWSSRTRPEQHILHRRRRCHSPGCMRHHSLAPEPRAEQRSLPRLREAASSTTAKFDVRFWHKADMLNALTNVRYWGQNGHDANRPLCRLSTLSRRFQQIDGPIKRNWRR